MLAFFDPIQTLASVAVGVVLGWFLGRSSVREDEDLRRENAAREREREALRAIARVLSDPAEDLRLYSAIAAGEEGPEKRKSILAEAADWWPPIRAELEEVRKQWRHTWRFDVEDRTVREHAAGQMLSMQVDAALRESNDEFARRLSILSSDVTRLENAVAEAAGRYRRRTPAMSKWQWFWRGVPERIRRLASLRNQM